MQAFRVLRQMGAPQLSILAVLTLTIALLALAQYQRVLRLPPGRISEEVLHWETRIRSVGADAAYAEFTASIAGQTVQTQHAAAHNFGKALYLEDGFSHLTLCINAFNPGCMHEFFSEAIADRGLGAVPQLSDICNERYGNDLSRAACEHAIGHGLLAYLGYSPSALDQALALCNSLSTQDKGSSCFTGVFMEYNERFFLGADARVRALGNDVFAPCDQVEETYRAWCYYWQGNWWRKVLPIANSVELFRTMGSYCASVPTNDDMRGRCFEGIGYAAAWQGMVEATVPAALCVAAASSSEQQQNCFNVAAMTLALHRGTTVADRLCSSLTGEAQTTCLVFASGEPAVSGFK